MCFSSHYLLSDSLARGSPGGFLAGVFLFEEAIVECQGQRNPNANTCVKLAALYTIKNELFGKSERLSEPAPDRGYSASSGPVNKQPETYVYYDSGTEFSRAIDGKDAYAVWEVMDELLSVLQATNPRLFDGVMRKIEEI